VRVQAELARRVRGLSPKCARLRYVERVVARQPRGSRRLIELEEALLGAVIPPVQRCCAGAQSWRVVTGDGERRPRKDQQKTQDDKRGGKLPQPEAAEKASHVALPLHAERVADADSTQIAPTSTLTCGRRLFQMSLHVQRGTNIWKAECGVGHESSQLASGSPRRHLNAEALAARLRLAPSTERE
jgi:hypothetical protein